MKEVSIKNYLVNAVSAQTIIDNNYQTVKDIDDINSILNTMLQDSHVMPAFGVSIHTETIKEMQNGIWLKLKYSGRQCVDDMYFDELLIEVKPEYSGFNIIRGNKGIYEGRCYYIDLLGNTMSELYNHILQTL